MWRQTLIIFCLVPETFAVTSLVGDVVANNDCPQGYIAEGKSLECECKVKFTATSGSRPTDFSVTWPGYSDNSKLKVMNVSRADNGTVFTCLMTWGGQKRTADYILKVPYGPDDEYTKIHGPSLFITNGTQWLSLTCNSTEVNPSPRYTWDGVTCHNADTDHGLCVFKPQPPWDDGREAKCIASSQAGENHKLAVAGFRLNLTYPPPKIPEISGYGTGQLIKNGDKLFCSVSGGKPLVKRVLFSCASDQRLEDQEDTTLGLSVSSHVTISSDNMVNVTLHCSCSAIWEPENNLYSYITRIVLFVRENEEHPEQVKTVIAATLPLGFLILIITGILAAIRAKIRTRKGFVKASTESCKHIEDTCQEENHSDYEDVDPPGIWPEPNAEHTQGSSSVGVHSVLYSDTKYPDVKFTLLAKEVRQKVFGRLKSSTGVNLQQQTESASIAREAMHLPEASGETTHLTKESSENVYNEIDITAEDRSVLAGLTHACTSTNALTHNVHDDCKSDVYSRASVLSPVGDVTSSGKVEGIEVYDTLRRS